MMAHVVALKGQIKDYIATVQTLYKLEDGSRTFFTRFNSLITGIDTSMYVLDTTLRQLKSLGEKAHGFSSAMQTLRARTAGLRHTAPMYVGRSKETLMRIAVLVQKLDQAVSTSASLVQRAESLQNNADYLSRLSNVQKRISSLHDALETINEKEPALPARPKW
jgi:hypothetical protein